MKQILRFALTVSLGLSIGPIFSQSYSWIPNEVRHALMAGTRTSGGLPGANYWQNHAKYNIKATLQPNESTLKGSETITYFNNSPDTLKTIYIRLYQDFYKKGGARAWNIGPEDITNGVQILGFTLNGKEAKLVEGFGGRYHFGTNRPVQLKTPLNPNDSLQITFQWKFHIPEKAQNRMGNYGKGRYFIAYWYPQIDVYDDISGWDKIEFTGIVEFYNDFNDYDVQITVPADYAVWATGHLQNRGDLFSNVMMRRINKAEKSDKIQHIITQKDWKKKMVLKTKGESHWHFKAKKVTDFSFAAMPRYNWDASSVMVDSSSRRRVLVSAIYPDSSNSFDKAARYARMSILFMSYKWPGYPYPFEHMTSVSNGTQYGGMETPMMANDGDPKDTISTAGLIFHEISHSYFPFYMGTNEKKYAWMDEGWAAYLTGIFSQSVAPAYHYFARTAKRFSAKNGNEMEMPLMIPSNLISDFGYYRVQAYTRSSLAYKFLRDAMGDSLFHKALTTYIQRWNGKHPLPYDFFNTFNAVAKKDLSWFINPWFFEKATADQSIKKVTNDNKIIVENVGGLPMPVKATCIFDDGSHETISKTTAVWSHGNRLIMLQANPKKNIVTIVLGDSEIPDINKGNNRFEREP